MQIVNPSKMMAKKTTDTILSSSLICIVSTLLDAPKQWIEAGRVIQRIMLYLVANDLKVSISVASIQDRDGLIKLSKYVDKRYKPQFFLCAGYSTVSRRITPRYSLEEKLK